MSLADHYEENSGGNYLGVGWHEVRIKPVHEVKEVGQNNHPKLVLTLVDASGAERWADFFLTEKSLWRLAQFARACGVTQAEMESYDTSNLNSHKVLHGKSVLVLIEKPGKYHELTKWMPTGSTPPAYIAPAPVAEPAPVVANQDIPF